MKILMIIPMLTLSIVSRSRATTLPFESISITPFYNKKESTIVVKTNSSYLRFLVFIKNDKYLNICIASDTITKPGTYKYTYNNEYTRPKNQVYVRYTTDTVFNDSPSFSRDIAKSTYRYIEDNQGFSSNNTLAVLNGNLIWTTKTLSYEFEGFEGIYVPQYFHKIRLKDFSIIPTSDLDLFSCDASLIINNYNDYFNDIEGSTDIVTFDLKTAYKTPVYYFELKDYLYVDPETLLMSSESKTGYVKTEHIYLPVNEMHNQTQYKCYLYMRNFGIDNDLVIHQFEIKALKNVFGDCSNSQYCIMRE